MCKIGLTSGSAKKRVSQTENPDYELCYEYPVPQEQLYQIEKVLHDYFEGKFPRLKHRSSGRKSEWFECRPEEAHELFCSGLIPGVRAYNNKTNEILNNNIINAIKSSEKIKAEERWLKHVKVIEVNKLTKKNQGTPQFFIFLIITLVSIIVAARVLSD